MASSKKTSAKKKTVKKAAPAKKTASKATSVKKDVKKEKISKKPEKKAESKKTAVKTVATKKVSRVGKKEIITSFQHHSKDTGSPKVQVALLTERINALTDHLKDHKNDNHSRRGLILMVGKRRRLLRYISTKDKDLFEKLSDELGIRK